ncbi:MAG: hypothetical protein GY834_03205, partial [Bacteroidetes bacterium]|nr:hypothetical protein [Bacteroidota bacterium]
NFLWTVPHDSRQKLDRINPSKALGLVKYKHFLAESGNKISSAKTTYDDLMKIKKVFLDSYDPSMDVKHMNVDDILEKGFTEKVSDTFVEPLKFWKVLCDN